MGIRHLSLDEPETSGSATNTGQGSLSGSTLREIERNAIVETLREFAGNRTKTAQALGIDRSTLRRKLKEFDLDGS